MKTYLIYKLSYFLMMVSFGFIASAQEQSFEKQIPKTAESVAKSVAQKYTLEKLKPYTTILEVPLDKMIIKDLGNGRYKITEYIKIAYNSIPEKLIYEVYLHYSGNDLNSSVIDSFKRIEK
ncbi:hypothetical protein D3C80_379320 [compost metagenome]